MTFSEFHVGILVKLKGIKIWVAHTCLAHTRGGVEYRAASFEVGLWTTAHHAAISPGGSARSASWIELLTQHVLCLRPGKPSW